MTKQVSTVIEDPASVDAAIESRFSTRAFLPRPVPREIIIDILRVAQRAPSGTNTQPWKVYVLQGASRDSLVEKVCAAHDAIYANPALAAEYREEYAYYPEKWVSPYIDRRRENGWGLYGLLGITKGDKDKMHAQHHRNFRFFDAPVGFMFTRGSGDGTRFVGRLRHVHAEHHGCGARPWPAHLPASRLERLWKNHPAAYRRRPG